MFGEQLARASGIWSPAADGGEEPGRWGGFSRAPLRRLSPKAANPFASSLIPLAGVMAPQVRDASSVPEGPMLVPSS